MKLIVIDIFKLFHLKTFYNHKYTIVITPLGMFGWEKCAVEGAAMVVQRF